MAGVAERKLTGCGTPNLKAFGNTAKWLELLLTVSLDLEGGPTVGSLLLSHDNIALKKIKGHLDSKGLRNESHGRGQAKGRQGFFDAGPQPPLQVRAPSPPPSPRPRPRTRSSQEIESGQVRKRREGGTGPGPEPCGLHGAGPQQSPAPGTRPPCPGLSKPACCGPVQARQVPVPPEARGPLPLGGCQGDGAVYQLVAARHRRRMELSCEVRGQLWVPRN